MNVFNANQLPLFLEIVKLLASLNSGTNDRNMYDLDNDNNDPDGFLRHSANTVNTDSDDDGYDDHDG